jgi:hypothetical protein
MFFAILWLTEYNMGRNNSMHFFAAGSSGKQGKEKATRDDSEESPERPIRSRTKTI